jgi:hypothetical protein
LAGISVAGCVVSVRLGEGVKKIFEASQNSLQKQFEVEATRNDVAMQLGAPAGNADVGDFEVWSYGSLRVTRLSLMVRLMPVA